MYAFVCFDMFACGRLCVRLCASVCVCVRARARARVCVCVCVCACARLSLSLCLSLSPPGRSQPDSHTMSTKDSRGRNKLLVQCGISLTLTRCHTPGKKGYHATWKLGLHAPTTDNGTSTSPHPFCPQSSTMSTQRDCRI